MYILWSPEINILILITFEAASVYESGDQLGTFGAITLDKKISRYCPFKQASKKMLTYSLFIRLERMLTQQDRQNRPGITRPAE
jgi:hypothetical protein